MHPDVSFEVSGTTPSGPPEMVKGEIVSVTTDPQIGTSWVVRLFALSTARISFISYTYDGPDGGILGGGHDIGDSAQQVPGQDTLWFHDTTLTVDRCAVSGEYSYTWNSVENQAMKKSTSSLVSVSINVDRASHRRFSEARPPLAR